MSRMRKICLVLAAVMCFSCVFGMPVYAENTNKDRILTIPENTELNSLTAKSIILMDGTTGTIIFERNSREEVQLASITKVMSMMIVMDAINNNTLTMDDIVTTSSHAASMGGSQVYLKEGEEFTVREMLKAVAIHSANDCTVALAEKVCGSESTFVDRMNEKAKELGMNDTYFLDCTGLTDDGHYSTAYDIAIMSREVVNKYPSILEFTSIWHDTFRDGAFSLDNTNRLVNSYNGLDGLKTGFTTKAGYCLTATAKRDTLRLVSVVLGTDGPNVRFQETKKLLDYGFANVQLLKANKKDEIVKRVDIQKGVEKSVNAVYQNDLDVTILKRDKGKLERNIIILDNITAPLKKGEVIGSVEYKIGDEIIAKENIVSKDDVKKASFVTLMFRAILNWLGIK